MAERRDVSGVLLLDKPTGLSSNAALQRVKRLFGARKAGHAGTLDPMATGLLPICFGETTKFSGLLLAADKTYDAWIRLGETTDTGDAEGKVTRRRLVRVSDEAVEHCLQRFIGEISQTPPMLSAIKYRGKPLYFYARAGVEIEREARRVTIYALKLIELRDDHLAITVTCSKGTYVRVLAEDIGEALCCGGHLRALRRAQLGEMNIAAAVSLERLDTMTGAERDVQLRAVDSFLMHFPSFNLSRENACRLLQGQAIAISNPCLPGLTRIYDDQSRFLGIGECDAEGRIRGKRLITMPVNFSPALGVA